MKFCLKTNEQMKNLEPLPVLKEALSGFSLFLSSSLPKSVPGQCFLPFLILTPHYPQSVLAMD